jgi:hypothetical protein
MCVVARRAAKPNDARLSGHNRNGMTRAMGEGSPRIWILDDIHNGGFSGGPVVFRTGAEPPGRVSLFPAL